MIVSIIGDKDTQKSQYAEHYATVTFALPSSGGRVYYIATMRVKTDADKEKVEKLRKRRESREFITIEQDTAIVRAIDKIKWMESLLGAPEGERTALIECLPRLAFNEMFLDSGEIVPHKEVESTILCGIALLKEFFDNIIIVSDYEADPSYYGGIIDISKEALEEYKEAMKELNAAIKTFSDDICDNFE